jgi:hypothetical protein
MTDISNHPTRRSAPHRTLGRLCGLLLALALLVASTPATAPAQAAPPAQDETPATMRFYLNVAHPGKFCAGQEYSILVTPHAEMQVNELGGRVTTRDSNVAGVLIKAEITDTSLATISPARQTSSGVERFGQPSDAGAVTFRLKALKAGVTTLIFTAEVPARFGAGPGRYFGPRGNNVGLGLEVQDCEYLVTVTYTWQLSGTGFRYWTVGSLRARITASDPEYYGGDGLFDFFLNHYDVTCNDRLSYQNPNHITAHRNLTTHQLELTFSMTPGPVSQKCPNTYLLSNAPFSDPASPWAGTPIMFTLEGGTQRLELVPNAPGRPPTGWVTITVQPITAGGR